MPKNEDSEFSGMVLVIFIFMPAIGLRGIREGNFLSRDHDKATASYRLLAAFMREMSIAENMGLAS